MPSQERYRPPRESRPMKVWHSTHSRKHANSSTMQTA